MTGVPVVPQFVCRQIRRTTKRSIEIGLNQSIPEPTAYRTKVGDSNGAAVQVLASKQVSYVSIDIGLNVPPFASKLGKQITGIGGAVRVRFRSSDDRSSNQMRDFNISFILIVHNVDDLFHPIYGCPNTSIVVKELNIGIEPNFGNSRSNRTIQLGHQYIVGRCPTTISLRVLLLKSCFFNRLEKRLQFLVSDTRIVPGCGLGVLETVQNMLPGIGPIRKLRSYRLNKELRAVAHHYFRTNSRIDDRTDD